jgi:hypothetical protein
LHYRPLELDLWYPAAAGDDGPAMRFGEFIGLLEQRADHFQDDGALFFSAGFLNSATWRRETSQGNWKKATGIGIGFNLDVQTAFFK